MDRRIPDLNMDVKHGQADIDHGGWLPRMSVPGPHVSEQKKRATTALHKKVTGDHLSICYCYTTLPLLAVAEPPSLAYSRLHEGVARAGVDGVRALTVGLAGAAGLAVSQTKAVAAFAGELVDLAAASPRPCPRP
jgi:hypothetical protein